MLEYSFEITLWRPHAFWEAKNPESAMEPPIMDCDEHIKGDCLEKLTRDLKECWPDMSVTAHAMMITTTHRRRSCPATTDDWKSQEAREFLNIVAGIQCRLLILQNPLHCPIPLLQKYLAVRNRSAAAGEQEDDDLKIVLRFDKLHVIRFAKYPVDLSTVFWKEPFLGHLGLSGVVNENSIAYIAAWLEKTFFSQKEALGKLEYNMSNFQGAFSQHMERLLGSFGSAQTQSVKIMARALNSHSLLRSLQKKRALLPTGDDPDCSSSCKNMSIPSCFDLTFRDVRFNTEKSTLKLEISLETKWASLTEWFDTILCSSQSSSSDYAYLETVEIFVKGLPPPAQDEQSRRRVERFLECFHSLLVQTMSLKIYITQYQHHFGYNNNNNNSVVSSFEVPDMLEKVLKSDKCVLNKLSIDSRQVGWMTPAVVRALAKSKTLRELDITWAGGMNREDEAINNVQTKLKQVLEINSSLCQVQLQRKSHTPWTFEVSYTPVLLSPEIYMLLGLNKDGKRQFLLHSKAKHDRLTPLQLMGLLLSCNQLALLPTHSECDDGNNMSVVVHHPDDVAFNNDSMQTSCIFYILTSMAQYYVPLFMRSKKHNDGLKCKRKRRIECMGKDDNEETEPAVWGKVNSSKFLKGCKQRVNTGKSITKV